MQIIRTILLFILLSNSCLASSIEDLQKQLSETTDPIEKVDLLNDLSDQLKYKNTAISIKYADQALELADANDYLIGKGLALCNLGTLSSNNNDLGVSMDYLLRAMEIGESIGSKVLLSKVHNRLGIDNNRLDRFEKSEDHFKKAIDFAVEDNDLKSQCFAMLNLGDLYYKNENKDKARLIYHNTIQLIESNKSIEIGHIPSYHLGIVHKRELDYKLAIEYFKKSIESGHNNLYNLYAQENIADIYKLTNSLSDEEMHLRKCMSLLQKVDESYVVNFSLKLANNLLKQEKLKEADLTLGTLSSYYNSMELNNKIEYNNYFAKLYTQQGFQTKAISRYKLLNTLRDSAVSIENFKMESKFEIQNAFNKAEQKNKFLVAEQIKNEKLIKSRQNLIILISIIAILSSLLAFFIYRLNLRNVEFNRQLKLEVAKKTISLDEINKNLTESNESLKNFAFMASHDLKSPLRSIASFSKLVNMKLKSADEDIQSYLGFINSSATRMASLVDDLLLFSQIGNVKNLELEHIDLKQLIEEIKNLIKPYLDTENAFVNVKADNAKFYCNKSQVLLLFKNLISNGVKYNDSEKKHIDIFYSDNDTHHQFSVQDNGISIDEEQQSKIFNMFTRLHGSGTYEGTGIGLAICKKIVNSFRGEIYCESHDNGSTFKFSIPKNLK